MDKVPPEPISGFNVYPSDQLCTLKWQVNRSSDYNGLIIRYYETNNNATVKQIKVDRSALSHIIVGLINGRSYTFEASSVDEAGNRSSVVTKTAVPAGKNTAILINTPQTYYTDGEEFSVNVIGLDIVSYQYRLKNGVWSANINSGVVLKISELDQSDDGYYNLDVIGIDSEGESQSKDYPTRFSWCVDTEPPEFSASVLFADGDFSRKGVSKFTVVSGITDLVSLPLDILCFFFKDLIESNEAEVGTQLTSSQRIDSFWLSAKDESGKEATSDKFTVSGLYSGPYLTTASADNESEFIKSVSDNDGNIISVGYIKGNGVYQFGSFVIQGNSEIINGIVIKSDNNGNILWVKTIPGNTNGYQSCFNSVAIDLTGHIYAAGNFNNNAVVYKITSENNVISSLISVTQGNESSFNSIIIDSGFIYTAGYVTGTNSYEFNNSETGFEGGAVGKNAVVVRFNLQGTLQDIVGMTSGSGSSEIYSLAVDSTLIFGVGYITGIGDYCFSSENEFNGGYASGKNALLVKINKSNMLSPVPVTKTTGTAGGDSVFYDLALYDTSIYVVGALYGSGNISFGAGAINPVYGAGNNAVLLKFVINTLTHQDTLRSIAAVGSSEFRSIVYEDSKFYLTGFLSGKVSFTFDTSEITGGSAGTNGLVLSCDDDLKVDYFQVSGNSVPSSYNDIFYNNQTDKFIVSGTFNSSDNFVVPNNTFTYNRNTTIKGAYTGINPLSIIFQ